MGRPRKKNRQRCQCCCEYECDCGWRDRFPTMQEVRDQDRIRDALRALEQHGTLEF